jgi:hypothetical protein
MADGRTIRETLEQLVNDVFTTGIPLIRDQVVERVMQQLQPLLPSLAKGGRVEQLNSALAAIHSAPAQTDVLRVLLDGVAVFCGRAALFLVRGNSAAGWQARGFRENDAIRSVTVDVTAGLAECVIAQGAWVDGPAAEFDSRLAGDLGAPSDGQCLVAPLAVRERIVALIYADAGPQSGGAVDRSALETLIRAAATWIELLALRKSAQMNNAAPNVGLTPGTANPAAADSPPAPAPVPAPAPAPVSQPPSPELEELNRKARRFAKLLVDEIKLYHQDKVALGRQHRDLYTRLKEDIEKSRVSYDKRYRHTAVSASNYFTEELIRNLADNDPNLLGSSFPR